MVPGAVPLTVARGRGNVNAPRSMPMATARVNMANADDRATPVSFSAQSRHRHMVCLLLAAKADTNIARRRDKDTPYARALQKGQF